MMVWSLFLMPFIVSCFSFSHVSIQRRYSHLKKTKKHSFLGSSQEEDWNMDESVKETIRRLAEDAKLRKLAKQAKEEADAQRMSMIRSIQSSYYASSSTSSETRLSSRGFITNLTTWQVHWTELPGRSNVLNIHNPMFIHMFESIIRASGPKPWFLGHLLQNATVGTLMRITDYRRVKDGRMILFVQGLDRFVLLNATQNRNITQPQYDVNDVLVLPDFEEIQYFFDTTNTTNNAATPQEQAIYDSFQNWQNYEYDPSIQLPIRSKSVEISLSDIYGPDLQTIMPFATYSKTINNNNTMEEYTSSLPSIHNDDCQTNYDDDYWMMETKNALKHPQSHPEIHRVTIDDNVSNDELEYQLWIYMDEFIRTQMEAKTKNMHVRNANTTTNKFIAFLAPLLILLPSTLWPDNFISHQLQQQQEQSDTTIKLIEEYPKHRRQRRLSYISSILLEYAGLDNGIRQILLEIPSTRARFIALIERFELINSQLLNGEFS